MPLPADVVARTSARVGRALDKDSLFARPISQAAIDGARDYLDRGGPLNSLVFMLRMREPFFAQAIAQTSADGLANVIARSLTEESDGGPPPLATVRNAWLNLVGGDGPWSSIVEFHGIHACMVRGQADLLKKFLISPTIQGPKSPIAGIIRRHPVAVPERGIDWQYLGSLNIDFLKWLADYQAEFRSENENAINTAVLKLPKNLNRDEFLHFIPAITGEPISSLLGFSGEERIRRVIEIAKGGGAHLDSLGMGNVTRFGQDAGRDQVVVVMDSGADEFAPFLQKKVSHYVRFDPYGHFKRVFDATDAACHGTKMSSLICGAPFSLLEAGITKDFVSRKLEMTLRELKASEHDTIRLGVAPGAQVVSVSVLSGTPLSESASQDSIVAGFDWIVRNRDTGIRQVNVSIEATDTDPHTEKAIDLAMQVLHSSNIQPIVAVGNHGAKSTPITRNACVVGAAQANGEPWANNGSHADLLAPGVNIPCGQPMLERFDNLLVDAYTGSSIATAIVSGCVAALGAEFPELTAPEATAILKATARNKMVSLDAAYEKCLREGRTPRHSIRQ